MNAIIDNIRSWLSFVLLNLAYKIAHETDQLTIAFAIGDHTRNADPDLDDELDQDAGLAER